MLNNDQIVKNRKINKKEIENLSFIFFMLKADKINKSIQIIILIGIFNIFPVGKANESKSIMYKILISVFVKTISFQNYQLKFIKKHFNFK